MRPPVMQPSIFDETGQPDTPLRHPRLQKAALVFLLILQSLVLFGALAGTIDEAVRTAWYQPLKGLRYFLIDEFMYIPLYGVLAGIAGVALRRQAGWALSLSLFYGVLFTGARIVMVTAVPGNDIRILYLILCLFAGGIALMHLRRVRQFYKIPAARLLLLFHLAGAALAGAVTVPFLMMISS